MAEIAKGEAPGPNAGIETETASNMTAQPNSPGIVGFSSEHDTYNSLNWSMRKKVYTSLLYSLTSFGSVWASTAYGPLLSCSSCCVYLHTLVTDGESGYQGMLLPTRAFHASFTRPQLWLSWAPVFSC